MNSRGSLRSRDRGSATGFPFGRGEGHVPAEDIAKEVVLFPKGPLLQEHLVSPGGPDR